MTDALKPPPARQRIYAIFNPTAGRSHYQRFLKIEALLEEMGCEVTVKHTTRRGDAVHYARAIEPGKYDCVVAAGGDGTINEVLNGLIGRGIPLGIIPLGTANVLAQEIGLALNNRTIAETIVHGAAQTCYPGAANERRFILMAGVGFDAHVVQTVSTRLKRLIGKGAYVWKSLVGLFQFADNSYRVTIGDETFEVSSAIIGKGRYYGGRFICTPDARMTKNTFQACLFLKKGPLATLGYMTAMVLGKVPTLEDIRLIEASTILIEGKEGEPVQGDGDIIAHLPLAIEIEKQTIDIICPQ